MGGWLQGMPNGTVLGGCWMSLVWLYPESKGHARAYTHSSQFVSGSRHLTNIRNKKHSPARAAGKHSGGMQAGELKRLVLVTDPPKPMLLGRISQFDHSSYFNVLGTIFGTLL